LYRLLFTGDHAFNLANLVTELSNGKTNGTQYTLYSSYENEYNLDGNLNTRTEEIGTSAGNRYEYLYNAEGRKKPQKTTRMKRCMNIPMATITVATARA